MRVKLGEWRNHGCCLSSMEEGQDKKGAFQADREEVSGLLLY